MEGEVSGECSGSRRRLNCTTLYAWKEAVSPHLAVEREAGGVEDEQLLGMVQSCLWKGVGDKEKAELWTVIETAGGVASPGPSGTLQCDLYRYCYCSIIRCFRRSLLGLWILIGNYKSIGNLELSGELIFVCWDLWVSLFP